MKRTEPDIVILGNLGDQTPFDYGGFIVFRYVDRRKPYIGAEYWAEPSEEEARKYTVWTAEVGGQGLGEYATKEEALREVEKRVKNYTTTESMRGKIVEFWVDEQLVAGVYREERSEDKYTVYRFDIEDDPIRDLAWADWWNLVDTFDVSLTKLAEMSESDDPLERAELYRMAGDYHGWENIDGYPLVLSRSEIEKRWPEFA